jgi:hypothetical protein
VALVSQERVSWVSDGGAAWFMIREKIRERESSFRLAMHLARRLVVRWQNF